MAGLTGFVQASLYACPRMHNKWNWSLLPTEGEVYFSTPESGLSPVTCLVIYPWTEGGRQAEV